MTNQLAIDMPGRAAIRKILQGSSQESETTRPLGPMTPPIVDRVLHTSGRPLDRTIQSAFQDAPPYSLGEVRIHTDREAADSATAIGAEAYTYGTHIVFGPGRYRPESPEGSELLSHELAHVAQQRGAGNTEVFKEIASGNTRAEQEADRIARSGGGQVRETLSRPAIQRKEIPVSIVGRMRMGHRAPQDWFSVDRRAWRQASRSGTLARLPQANTFILAAIYNTHSLRPQEYATIAERYDYYDLISYVIEHDSNAPQEIRGVRFFHAANLVTGSPGVGSIESLGGKVKLSSGTRDVLQEVNAELFAENMRIIRNLLLDWREPRDPLQSESKQTLSAFEFDLKMVEFEQGTVERYLLRKGREITPEIVDEINGTLDPNWLEGFVLPSAEAMEWAIAALGVSKLDFTVLAHRVAIGIATVHKFHRRAKAEYLRYMAGRGR